METIVIKKDEFERNGLLQAADIIKKGGLAAFPTETVYGLGGNALDKMAAHKIYKAKGRPSDNPLIVHIGNIEQLALLTDKLPEKAKFVIEKFWPGPLTIILKKKEAVPYEITGGLETVAVRMPDNEIALALINEAKVPIAAPSANISGRPSPTSVKHVIADLFGRIDMIIDGGQVGIGIESTILDLTADMPVILRPGYITKDMIESVLGKIEVDKAILEPMKDDIKPKAPGMKYKHYAPKAELKIIKGNSIEVVKYINAKTSQMIENGLKVGIIGTKETEVLYYKGVFKSIGIRTDYKSIAYNMYSVLREFDDIGVDIIFSEDFSDSKLGEAIMNRLGKAASYQIENL